MHLPTNKTPQDGIPFVTNLGPGIQAPNPSLGTPTATAATPATPAAKGTPNKKASGKEATAAVIPNWLQGLTPDPKPQVNELGMPMGPVNGFDNVVDPLQTLDPSMVQSQTAEAPTINAPNTLPTKGGAQAGTQAPTGLGLADALQYGELAAKAAMLARGYDRQPYRVSNSPVTLRAVDPTRAFTENQYASTAALRNARNTSSRAQLMGNTQNILAQQLRANAATASQYANMNVQAQRDYEQRLGQQDQFNVQSRLRTDQIRQQDEAAYFNQLYDIMTSVGNIGRAKGRQKENQAAVEMILKAFPGLAAAYKG